MFLRLFVDRQRPAFQGVEILVVGPQFDPPQPQIDPAALDLVQTDGIVGVDGQETDQPVGVGVYKRGGGVVAWAGEAG